MTVWLADDYYNEPPMLDLMKEFHQAYPNITISVQHYEWGKMRNKLRDAVGSGQSPDVAHQHAFVFGAQGYAESLDDLWKQWGEPARAAFYARCTGRCDLGRRALRCAAPTSTRSF